MSFIAKSSIRPSDTLTTLVSWPPISRRTKPISPVWNTAPKACAFTSEMTYRALYLYGVSAIARYRKRNILRQAELG